MIREREHLRCHGNVKLTIALEVPPQNQSESKFVFTGVTQLHLSVIRLSLSPETSTHPQHKKRCLTGFALLQLKQTSAFAQDHKDLAATTLECRGQTN